MVRYWSEVSHQKKWSTDLQIFYIENGSARDFPKIMFTHRNELPAFEKARVDGSAIYEMCQRHLFWFRSDSVPPNFWQSAEQWRVFYVIQCMTSENTGFYFVNNFLIYEFWDILTPELECK